MRRVLNILHATTGGQVFWRHVFPGLSIIARDMDGSVIRTGPDDAALQPGCLDRIKRTVDFFARNIPRDRLARNHLLIRFVGREVGADSLPVHPIICGAMEVLRTVIDDPGIVRGDFDGRLADEAIRHILRVMSVAILRIYPVMLLLSRGDVVAPKLALADAIDNLASGMGTNLTCFAT